MTIITHVLTMDSPKKLYESIRGTISVRLLGLFIVSVIVMLIANDSSLARDTLCEFGVCFRSTNPEFWNGLLYDFAAGCAITVMFYWILVRWPEYLKRQRVKRHLAAQYRAFKISCIENFLAVADGSFSANHAEELVSVVKFRDYFKQDIGNNKQRWHDVANHMSEYYLDVTLSRMEILRQEISFAMHSIDFSENDAFEILKRLSHSIVMQRNATQDYDSIKSFLRIYWELFTGWDFVQGYRDTDLIEEIIESI